MLVDSHVNLHGDKFAEDREEVIGRAFEIRCWDHAQYLLQAFRL